MPVANHKAGCRCTLCRRRARYEKTGESVRNNEAIFATNYMVVQDDFDEAGGAAALAAKGGERIGRGVGAAPFTAPPGICPGCGAHLSKYRAPHETYCAVCQ